MMVTKPPGPYVLTPVFQESDVIVEVTLIGTGSISGWLFLIEIDDEHGNNVLLSDSATYVNITDAGNRKVTWSTNGLNLNPGIYYWKLRRTDVGNRTVCAYGEFRVRTDNEP